MLEPRVLFSADIVPGLAPDVLAADFDVPRDLDVPRDFNQQVDSPAASTLTIVKDPGAATLLIDKSGDESLHVSGHAENFESLLVPVTNPDAPTAIQLNPEVTSQNRSTAQVVEEPEQPITHVSEQSTAIVEVVFIDSRVDDYQLLIEDLQRHDPAVRFSVVLVDESEDGLHKVSDTLEALGTVSAIHVISHGSDGNIQLGAATINQALLDVRGDEFVDWSDNLSAGADILIYGCDLAATQKGITLINQLSELCQCDVAASDDKTGHPSLSADWDLEFVTGIVETDIAISSVLQQSWQHQLDITSNLVAHYEFEEGVGSFGADSTGNNSGTIVAPTWSTDSAVGNYALDFSADLSGANSWFFAGDHTTLDFGAGDFTISFWMKSGVVPGSSVQVVSQSSGGPDGFNFFTDNFGDVNFGVNGGITFAENVHDNNWHLITGVKTAGALTLYHNGAFERSGTTSGGVGSSLDFRVGATGSNSNDFEGLIDDVRIYNRALSPADVSELYNTVNTAPSISALDNSPVYTEGSLPVLIDVSVQVADTELDALNSGQGNYSGAWLYLSRLAADNPEDQFSFTNANGLSTVGTQLQKNGVTIGTLDWVAGHISVVFTDVNGEIPTKSDVENFMQQVSYLNTSQAPPATVDLQWLLSDGNTGAQGSGGMLIADETILVAINAVNDAPDYDTSGDTRLLPVLENSSGGAGNSVADIIASAGGDRITDVDDSPLEGIAVVGMNGSGAWQYSLNAGSTWVNIGAASSNNALLLGANDLVRFEPATGFTGSAFLAVNAWDRTSGTAGSHVDVSINGLTTPYSTQTEAVSVDVVQITEVSISSLATSINEDADLFFSGLNTLTVDDGTSADTKLRVSLQVAHGKLKLGSTIGLTFISGTWNSESMVFEGTESRINAALDGMRYEPDNNYHGPESLEMSATLADIVGHYSFDGGTADDTSLGIGYNGTFRNGASTVTDLQRDEVLSLDSSAAQDVRIIGTYGNPTSVTAAAWVNANSTYAEVISLGGVFDIRVDDPNEGGKVVAFYYDGSQYHIARSDQTIANTGWHHLAASFDNLTREITLYIDGAEAASTTGVNPISYSGDTYIGSNTGGALHFDGLIDDVRVYDYALTAEQVAGLASDSLDAAQSVLIDVIPVNDRPRISDLQGDQIQVSNNGISQPFDAAVPVSITDIDSPDFDNGFLQVTATGFDAFDQLDIITGPVTLSSGVADGSVVSVSGVAIGAVSGINGTTLQVDFNSSATIARVETLLGSIAVKSTSTDYGYRTVNILLNDGDGGSDTAMVDVVVVAAVPGSVTTPEDVEYTFTAEDFSLAGAVGSDLREVTFTALPSIGTLAISGTPVTLSQSISKASLDAGDLTYTPLENSAGTAITNMQFFVNTGKHAVTILPGESSQYTPGGTIYGEFDDNLKLSSNFGSTGTYPAKVLIADTDSTIDSGYLADGDILFINYIPDADLNNTELAAIDQWVNSGGVLITASDESSHDPVSSYYGLPIIGSGDNVWNIVDHTHPVIDGPFGVVGNVDDPVYAFGAKGYFDRADLLPGDIEIAKDSLSGEPTIVIRQIGAGFIMFTADEGIFRAEITTPNDLLGVNTIAWAADNVTPDIYQLNIDVVAVNDQPVFTVLPEHQVQPETLAYGAAAFSTVADLNGDGSDDLIVIDSASSEVVYFNGDSSGVFSTNATAFGGFVEPVEVATGDLDTDGDIDLIVADYNTAQSSLVILANDGSGAFTSTVLEPASDGVVQVDSADLDDDGDIDIVANYWFSGELVWYENLGAGAFGRAVIDTQSGGTAVDAVDVNGDGFIDLVAAYSNSNSVIYYENDGAAGFVSQQYTASNAYDVAVADLNGDGAKDIAYVGLTGVMGWLQSDGSGNPVFSNIVLPVAPRTVQITSADIDGDGDRDLLTVRDTADQFGLYENDGAGSFSPQVFATGTLPAHITAVDLDADGDLEIITSDKGNTGIRIFENHGGGEFTRYSTVEDAPVTLSTITIDDMDAGTESLQLDMLVSGGVADLSSTTGLSFVLGDGIADNIMRFNGTLADINLALMSLSFQPHPSFNGSASIQVTVNDLGNSGTGGNKIAQEILYIEVLPVNDAPTVDSIEPDDLQYIENSGPQIISSALVIADVDDTLLESATVTISGYFPAEDKLVFADSVNITGYWDALSGTLTLTGTDSVANYQLALRSITYENTSELPSTLPRTISFAVNDGGLDSVMQSRTVDVVSVNDNPVVTGIEADNYNYTENDGAVSLTSLLLVTDADDTYLESAEISISSGYIRGEDILAFTNTPDITGTWNDNNGRLTLTGTDTVANYQLALRSVTYENTKEDPSTGILDVEVVVNDGDANSSAVSRSIEIFAVNDAPVVSSVETTAQGYVENAPPQPLTATIDLQDADNTLLQGAVVRFDSNYVPDEDLLSFTDTANITAVWNPSVGELVLSGTDSVAGYETALRSVSYHNSSDNPQTQSRYVSFVVDDGDNTSAPVLREIFVVPVNDPPNATGAESTALGYTEGDGPLAVTSSLTLSDVDDLNIEGASVVIAANFQSAEDNLSFPDTATITGNWDPVTGVLTLTGSDTITNYEAALRSVAYENTSLTPTEMSRRIDFLVSDGELNSLVESRQIDVNSLNSAPDVSAVELVAASYMENSAAIAVTESVVLTDSDDISLESSVVRIVSNYNAAEDVLGFSDTVNITHSWDVATGTLTLAGTDTVAAYQAALRSVYYENLSDNPSVATRSIEYSAFDGEKNSNAVIRELAVVATNDAPVASNVETIALSYAENSGQVNVSSTIVIQDVDNSSLNSAVVKISANYVAGEDLLSFADTANITGHWNATTGTLTLNGVDTVSGYEAALRSVVYENLSDSPLTQTRSVDFSVSDFQLDSNLSIREIGISQVNDSPQLSSIEVVPLVYTENDGDVAITSSITASDIDSADIQSAVVTIASGYQAGQDVLKYNGAGPIVGNWDSASGSLELTGSASVAAYETALRSITFQNTSENPVNATRTIAFFINDGLADSNIQSRAVHVSAINDPPVINSVESDALVYVENNEAMAVTSLLQIDDVDDNVLASAEIVFDSGYTNGEDRLSFTDTPAITGLWDPAAGSLTLSGTDSLLNYEAALRAVTYENTSNDPTSLPRVISFKVNDGGSDSTLLTRTVQVTPINDVPVVAAIETAPLSYLENSGVSTISATVSVDDVDHNLLESASVSFSSGYVTGEDQLVFANTATLTGSWDVVTGTLTVAGTDTVENYQAALRTVAYQNTSESPTVASRTVVYSVSDGESNSVPLAREINIVPVNDAPVISSVENTPVDYIENSAPETVSSELVLTDDNGNLQSATVTISGNYIPGEDVLGYAGSGLVSSWDATTGVLTLTGSETVAAYQSALRQITYQNLSDNPSALPKVIDFTVNDGQLNSNTQQRVLNVLPDNDAPVVASVEITSLDYLENSGTAITSSVTLSDIDNEFLQQATLQINGNFIAGEDSLRFSDTAAISSVWDEATGTLTLTGLDTIANYQAAIRAVVYENLSEAPTQLPRTVSISVNDGLADSNLQARAILTESINDAPVLNNIEAEPFSYTEGAQAVTVTDQLVVVDVDDALMQSARVSISGNYVFGEDTLEFSDTPQINGNWNPATGELLLTGADTVESYQNALRTVTYTNLSENPSTAMRTVSINVSDIALDSATVSRELIINPVNDAPEVTSGSVAPLIYLENNEAKPVFRFVEISDPDNTVLQSARVGFVSGYVEGEDYLQLAGTALITSDWDSVTGVLQLTGQGSVAEYQTLLRSLTYHNSSENPDTTVRVIDLSINDGVSSSNLQKHIEVVSVNDAPSGANATVAIDEDTRFVFSVSDFGFIDVAENHGFSAIRITADPVEGQLFLNNQVVATGQSVNVSEINSGSLSYQPPLNVNGQNADTFFFQVQDNGGTESGGMNIDVVARQMIIDIEAVNDAPFGIDTSLSGIEDTHVVIGIDDLGFSDPADHHSIDSIVISSVPVHGALYLNGVPLQHNTVIAASDIAAGGFSYLPEADEFGDNYASFEFTVIDNGGTANGGSNTAQATNTVVINVAAVNDAPIIVTRTLTVPEGAEQLLGTEVLNGIDIDNLQPVDLTFTLNSMPQNGAVLLAGDILAEQQSFSLADIISGNVSYRHDGSETSSDTVTFSLVDTENSNDNPALGALAIIVKEVLDNAPVIENDTLQLSFGQSFDSSKGDLLASGLNAVGGSVLQHESTGLTLALEQGPRHGTLDLFADGTFAYVHNGSAVLVDEFSYRITNEDGIFTVATVEILIEPPIASAFAPASTEPVIEFVSTETVETETEENLIEHTADNEEPPVDLTDSIAFGVSPFETESETEQSEDTRPVVTLDSVEVDNSNLVLHSEALEVKQHNQSVAPIAFENTAARIIESLDFEISSGDSRYGISNPPFLEGLLRLESDLGDAASNADKKIQLANEAVFGITISATAGVVAWIIRGGALFASVMAVTPLWSSIDPSNLLKSDKEEPEDQMSEEVERYFETG